MIVNSYIIHLNSHKPIDVVRSIDVEYESAGITCTEVGFPDIIIFIPYQSILLIEVRKKDSNDIN